MTWLCSTSFCREGTPGISCLPREPSQRAPSTIASTWSEWKEWKVLCFSYDEPKSFLPTRLLIRQAPPTVPLRTRSSRNSVGSLWHSTRQPHTSKKQDVVCRSIPSATAHNAKRFFIGAAPRSESIPNQLQPPGHSLLPTWKRPALPLPISYGSVPFSTLRPFPKNCSAKVRHRSFLRCAR